MMSFIQDIQSFSTSARAFSILAQNIEIQYKFNSLIKVFLGAPPTHPSRVTRTHRVMIWPVNASFEAARACEIAELRSLEKSRRNEWAQVVNCWMCKYACKQYISDIIQSSFTFGSFYDKPCKETCKKPLKHYQNYFCLTRFPIGKP